MDKEILYKRISVEYALVYNEIKDGRLKFIPKNKNEEKYTFFVEKTKNWGLSSGSPRKRGGMGDTTTLRRLKKLIDLNLLTEEDFANYKGPISLHKLIGSNNSDAKYILLYLLERINNKKSVYEHNNDYGLEEYDVKTEGALKTIVVNRYERDRQLREQKITANNGDYSCSICGFDFEKVYGNRGKGFIHVHHLIPLSKIKKKHGSQLDSLVLVCPNCHAMLHRGNDFLEPEELKNIIEKNRKEKT